ncbi:MAG: hypothetical protein RL233_737, partial [Bacteroidota bacterium]
MHIKNRTLIITRLLVLFAILLIKTASAQSPCKSFKNGWPSTKKAFEIVSILVDACDGSN